VSHPIRLPSSPKNDFGLKQQPECLHSLIIPRFLDIKASKIYRSYYDTCSFFYEKERHEFCQGSMVLPSCLGDYHVHFHSHRYIDKHGYTATPSSCRSSIDFPTYQACLTVWSLCNKIVTGFSSLPHAKSLSTFPQILRCLNHPYLPRDMRNEIFSSGLVLILLFSIKISCHAYHSFFVVWFPPLASSVLR
jgi:hypothetical protein